MIELGNRKPEDIPPIYRDYVLEYLEEVRKIYRERLISFVLFGSVGRGKAKPKSDIDVLLVVEDLPLTINERNEPLHKLYWEMMEKEGYKNLRASGRNTFIATFHYTPQEIKKHPPILLDIIHDGVIFYDKEEFFKNSLIELVARMNELGSKKVYVNEDTWYWILKPDCKLGERVEV